MLKLKNHIRAIILRQPKRFMSSDVSDVENFDNLNVSEIVDSNILDSTV